MSAIVVYCTTASLREAEKLADVLVKEKLAACVSLVPSIRSIYRWKGKIERAREVLLMVKTESNQFSRLSRRIKSLHSYTVPEILALPVVAGNPDYLKWLKKSVQK